MFRTILQFCPDAPKHFLMCDDALCGQTAICTLDAASFKADNKQMTGDYIESTQKMFFETLGGMGWLIGMDQILCPIHNKARVYAQLSKNEALQRAVKEVEAEQAQRQSRIVPPSSSDLVNITRNNGKLH